MCIRSAIKIIVIIFLFFCASNSQGSEPTTPAPIPIEPSKINLNGNWNYTRSSGTVRGSCPSGKAASGIILISQKGKQVNLSIITGSTCVPGSLCQFSGSLAKNQLTVKNRAVVDSEGGKVTNIIALTVISNELMQGSSNSSYKHPQGFACAWSSKIMFTRAPVASQTTDAPETPKDKEEIAPTNGIGHGGSPTEGGSPTGHGGSPTEGGGPTGHGGSPTEGGGPTGHGGSPRPTN